MTGCVLNELTGCLVCPEIPEQAYQDGVINFGANLGWNAGANSVATLGDDVHTIFSAPGGVVGIVLGFRSRDRSQQTEPTLIEHGFYLQSIGPLDFYSVIERGRERTTPAERAASDVLEIRRVRGEVTYLVNGVLTWTSTARSFGAKFITSTLYAAGDSIE